MKAFWLFLFLCSCGYMGERFEGEVTPCYFRVDRGFVVKWRELPIPAYIHESVPKLARQNYIYSLDMLNEAWNYYSGKGRLFELVGDIPTDDIPFKGEDGINVFFVDRKHKVLNPGQQGTTRVRNYFMGDIYEADIIVNNIHFKYYYEKEPFDYSLYTKVPELSSQRSFASTSPRSFWKGFLYAFEYFLNFLSFWNKKSDERDISSAVPKIPARKVDAISLNLHELLHVTGLTHDDSNENNILYPSLPLGQVRRNIAEKELSRLACGYGGEQRVPASVAPKTFIDRFFGVFLAVFSF